MPFDPFERTGPHTCVRCSAIGSLGKIKRLNQETIRGYRGKLRVFFDWAKLNHLVITNPMQRRVSATKPSIEHYTPEVIQDLCGYIRTPDAHPIEALILYLIIFHACSVWELRHAQLPTLYRLSENIKLPTLAESYYILLQQSTPSRGDHSPGRPSVRLDFPTEAAPWLQPLLDRFEQWRLQVVKNTKNCYLLFSPQTVHHNIPVGEKYILRFVQRASTRILGKSCTPKILRKTVGIMIAFGQTSDMIHFQIADITIELLPSDRLYIDREQYKKALVSYLPNMAASEIVRATEAFPQLWQSEENSERDNDRQDLWLQLDTAAQAEFGCPLSDLQKFMAAAYIISEDLDPAYACLPSNEFVDRVAAYLGWSKAQVNQVLHLLTLFPRSNFSTPYSLFDKDSCPWRYNRQLSYVRRPFIYRKQDETIEILWGNRHLYRVIPYIADLCLTGRLHAKSDEMRQLMSTIRMKQANAFNDRVAEIFKQNADLIVRTRVKKVGKLRPPGDIDILLADPKKRRLGILECKDFTLARTPRELDNELKKLFEGKHGQKSMVDQRADWASANVEQILNWLQVDGAGKASKWRVEPLIVVSQELLSPYLKRSRVHVLPLARLLKENLW